MGIIEDCGTNCTKEADCVGFHHDDALGGVCALQFTEARLPIISPGDLFLQKWEGGKGFGKPTIFAERGGGRCYAKKDEVSTTVAFEATCSTYVCQNPGWIKNPDNVDVKEPDEERCCEATCATFEESSENLSGCTRPEAFLAILISILTSMT